MPKIEYEEKNFNGSTLEIIRQAEQIVTEYEGQGFQLTLRQLYYQFVARGILENTERNYKRLGNIVSDARRAGLIDWDSIVDRTRHLRKLSSWSSPKSILETARDSFHRDLWENQERRIEVWIEKDALIGVIEKVCQTNDVPFFSCRGYVSDSEMWVAAMRILSRQDKDGQETIVLHLGDHDPSGLDMSRDIEERLRLFTQGNSFISVNRIALTMNQIEELKPPPNPAKITDSRFKGYQDKYGDDSYELDALEPKYLSNLIQGKIDEIKDAELWQEANEQQERERKVLADLIEKLGG
jgi:hypothetical protein